MKHCAVVQDVRKFWKVCAALQMNRARSKRHPYAVVTCHYTDEFFAARNIGRKLYDYAVANDVSPTDLSMTHLFCCMEEKTYHPNAFEGPRDHPAFFYDRYVWYVNVVKRASPPLTYAVGNPFPGARRPVVADREEAYYDEWEKAADHARVLQARYYNFHVVADRSGSFKDPSGNIVELEPETWDRYCRMEKTVRPGSNGWDTHVEQWTHAMECAKQEVQGTVSNITGSLWRRLWLGVKVMDLVHKAGATFPADDYGLKKITTRGCLKSIGCPCRKCKKDPEKFHTVYGKARTASFQVCSRRASFQVCFEGTSVCLQFRARKEIQVKEFVAKLYGMMLQDDRLFRRLCEQIPWVTNDAGRRVSTFVSASFATLNHDVPFDLSGAYPPARWKALFSLAVQRTTTPTIPLAPCRDGPRLSIRFGYRMTGESNDTEFSVVVPCEERLGEVAKYIVFKNESRSATVESLINNFTVWCTGNNSAAYYWINLTKVQMPLPESLVLPQIDNMQPIHEWLKLRIRLPQCEERNGVLLFRNERDRTEHIALSAILESTAQRTSLLKWFSVGIMDNQVATRVEKRLDRIYSAMKAIEGDNMVPNFYDPTLPFPKVDDGVEESATTAGVFRCSPGGLFPFAVGKRLMGKKKHAFVQVQRDHALGHTRVHHGDG